MTLYVGEVSKHHDSDHSTPEILDTGDGIQTLFTGRSEQYPIVFGTVQIEFTIGSVTYTVTESGGTFIHAQITAGTIDEDGNYSLQFATPLDDTTNLRILTYSTKGFLTKFLELVSVKPTKEVVATGNGATVTFGFTITGSGAIEPGNVRLRFVYMGVYYDLWDNATGEWIHDLITTSSINYSTRVCSITFSVPPEDTTDIDVWSVPAGESWVQVLEERQITQLNGANEPNHDGQKEVILYNSGISGREEIVIGLREYSYISQDHFGLELALGRRWTYQDDIDSYFWDSTYSRAFGFNHGGYNTTYTAVNVCPKFIYSNDSMKYWISVTKSRVHIIIRNTGTIFTSASFGEGIRYASQTAYPKPHYVIGSSQSFYPFSSGLVTGIHRPASNAGRILDNNGDYQNTSASATDYAYFFTMASFANYGLLKRTLKNHVFVQRIHLMYGGTPGSRQSTSKVLFALDGVFICPDNDIDSEHTINTTEYIVFQDVYRVTYQDYFCITQL